MPIASVKSIAGKVENQDDLAKEGYDTSVRILKEIIDSLEKKSLTEDQKTLMNRYFLLGDTNTEIPPQLAKTLQTTLDGSLNTDIEIEINMLVNFTKFKSKKIGILLANFKKPNQLVRYFIHEASHAFADTKDFGDSGYINNDGKFRAEGLTKENALNNADSYACFVVGCAGIALK